MSTPLTIISLAVVALLLARDWGHRRVTMLALLRPLIAIVIIPFFAPGWSGSGAGLALEAGGLVLGVAIGLLTFAFMRFSIDDHGQVWSDTGYTYVAIWIAFTAARLIFVYGTEHWFTRQIGSFLVSNHIAVDAFAYSIIFLFIAPILTNRLAILVRTRTLPTPAGAAPAAEARPTSWRR
jgi:hypothetical protein